MTAILIVLAVFLIILFGTAMIAAKEQAKKIAAMSPEQRNNYIWGDINIHLICPHCQTKGTVHAMMISKEVSSTTGKIGGIVKTKTETTTKAVVTQHHCVKCNSTWDI